MSSKSRTGLYAIIAIIVIVIVVVGVVFALMNNPGTSGGGSPLTLYAGEKSSSEYGFGNSAGTIASNPGPTLTLKTGTQYTLTLKNVGTMAHSWQITTEKSTSSSVLFGAKISLVQPGASATVTFTPNQVGTFYYICSVSGHLALGMWGTIQVTS